MIASPSSRSHPPMAELLNGITKIAGHRQILLQLNSLLEDESRGVEELVAVLRLDAGLCARVISAANTVFFRGGMSVASVDEAVIRVGVWEIRRLLLGSIAFELTGRGLPSYGAAAGEMWNRALATALAMDTLGREARRSTDVCYTIGLLHAVGLVVLDRWMNRPDNRSGRYIARVDAFDLEDRERHHTGVSSPEVGAELLAQWKFPESTVTCIRFQNQPLRAGRFRRLTCLLAVARWLSDTILATLDNGPLPDLPDAMIQRLAGVSSDEAFKHLDLVRERFLQYRSAVGVA